MTEDETMKRHNIARKRDLGISDAFTNKPRRTNWSPCPIMPSCIGVAAKDYIIRAERH